MLRTLAELCGVSVSYRGWDQEVHDVADSTMVGVLASLGLSAGNTDEVEASLRTLDEAPWRRMLPPSLVTVHGREHWFPVRVPHGSPLSAWIETEDGNSIDLVQLDHWVEPREIDGALVGTATFAVPTALETGWHTVHARTPNGQGDSCTLAVTPPRATRADQLNDRQRWGLSVQLYSVRSADSFGIGDFADLGRLAEITSKSYGGDFVLVNPLHASGPHPPIESSPYLPTTRRFVNPLYLRIQDIAESVGLTGPARDLLNQTRLRFAAVNQDPQHLDRNESFGAKLDLLAAIFDVTRSAEREAAFTSYRQLEGAGLDQFSTWCALVERFGYDNSSWPVGVRDRATAAAYDADLAPRIDFFIWLQWICDEQLADAQRRALDSGMDIGVMHDLALGVQVGGADTWMLGDTMAKHVVVGAPPDMFNQQGQRWNQSPWHPWRLAEHGYLPYRDMLRTVLRHAGGIRVDHILGLFRLWWIPEEAESASEGAYVRYDHEALLGILALEAERAHAVVIGEDLGVFEPEVPRKLTERGILGTSILWFEHGPFEPKPPETYRTHCLTSVTTHDLPPTLGYLRGDHIQLRDQLGLLEQELAVELENDARNREAVIDLARERGLLRDNADVRETIEALHALIARSPSMLLGVALVDAVGERRIQNQPGTDSTQYKNWCIPLADEDDKSVGIEDLLDNERFASLIHALTSGRVE